MTIAALPIIVVRAEYCGRTILAEGPRCELSVPAADDAFEIVLFS